MSRNHLFVTLGILATIALVLSLGSPAIGATTAVPVDQAQTPQAAATQTAQAVEAQALEKALSDAMATATPTPVPAATPSVPVSSTLLLPAIESTHPYADSFDDSWLISNTDPNAQATRIHLARLDLEKNVDWLIVTDGQDVEVQRLTGSYPDGVWTDIVPGNLVRLRLVSDGSVAGWGSRPMPSNLCRTPRSASVPIPIPMTPNRPGPSTIWMREPRRLACISRAWTWKRALTGLSSWI